MTDRRFINHQNLNDRGLMLSVDCRFCRLVQKYDKYDHVAPCGCVGNTRYVHRQCLEKWIVVKFEHVYNNGNSGDPEEFNIFCQVCQQRMEMEFTITNKLSNYQDVVEKITGKKILFSTLLLLLAVAIVGIIIISIYMTKYGGNPPPKLIFGISICCTAFIIIIVVFICNFMIIRSIVVDYIGNNKNPMILAMQANIDEVTEEEEGSEKDPYFGVQTKKDPSVNKSLMLQSKRDSSVVSKTLTDLVLQKMYKHDEPSMKGKSEKQFNESKSNRHSGYLKREPIKQTKDQEVQVQQGKGDKSVNKRINQLDQEVQPSLSLRDQSIQHSNHKKDASVQPSFLPKTRRIWKEDTSIVPKSSVAQANHRKTPQKVDEKQFASDYQESQSRQQQPPLYKPPTPHQPEIISSGDSKKSEDQLVKEVVRPVRDASPGTKLKLKTSKDPIKIRVMF